MPEIEELIAMAGNIVALPEIAEQALQTADEALPEFPRLPGPLGELVEAITDDLPYEHKSLAAITYVGLALSKRVTLIPDHWLQTRFYSCMVGPANNAKSAAEAEVQRALADEDAYSLGGVKIELSIDSGPALVQALEKDRRLILAPDELADQFEKARAGNAGRNSLFGELLRLYESNATGNFTKARRGEGGRVEIRDAQFALIGGATTQRFETMWTGSGGAASGLQSRFILSYSEQSMPRLKTPNDDAAIARARASLTEIIGDEEADTRRIRLSAAAQDLIMEWRPFEDDGRDAMKRMLDMAKRFALLLAACGGLAEIDGGTMELALRFADYQIALREKLFPPDASSFVQAFEHRIIRFFENHGSHSERTAVNWIKPEKAKGGFAAYNTAFRALRHAGKLVDKGKTRKNEIVWGLA